MAETYLNGHDHEVWEKILVALKDEQWEFRTVEGMAEEIGFSPETIQACIQNHESEVRQALVRDSDGRVLYTDRSRKKSLREFLSEMRAFAGQSI